MTFQMMLCLSSSSKAKANIICPLKHLKSKSNKRSMCTQFSTYGIFPSRMTVSRQRGPGLHSLFLRIAEGDWCSFSFVFVNLRRM